MDVGQLNRNKDRYLEYNKYWEQLARDSKLLNHTDQSMHFVRYSIMELFSAKHSELLSPYLGLEAPSMRLKNESHHNVQAVWRGAIVIGHSFEKGNITDRDKAMDTCFLILLKIVAKVNADRRALRIPQFDLNGLQANPVVEMFGGNRVGVRWEFEMPSQFDLGYYDADWRNATDTTPQPPFAEVFDGGQWNTLGLNDRWTCSSGNGTLILKDSQGVIIATYTIPPGDPVEENVADSAITLLDTDDNVLQQEDLPATRPLTLTAPNGVVQLWQDGGIQIGPDINVRSGELNKIITVPNGAVKAINSAFQTLGETEVMSNGDAQIPLANVIHTDSDGEPVELACGIAMECTLAPPSVGDRIYRSDFASPFAYCAYAPDGSVESDPVWRATRIEVHADGTLTILTATDIAWDDRLTVIYT